ncbi:MAG: FAD-binding oxidoreductase [Deltaproteobacteria bacterium]|nr:FAD-binding oxidoreductase [Deltaproteobacteria bacterium]
MGLPKGAYRALEDALGRTNVCDDPSVTAGYSYMWLMYATHEQSGRCRPAAVALPGSTEDIQTIIKIANRYGFSYIPVGTNLFPPNIPTRQDTIIIDPKRMNRILEIDEKNMYAVVEPYVTYAQLQAETMKKGLTIGVCEGGAQCSVLANNMFQGMAGPGHKFGINRGVLGCDWVLPNGEFLKIGSRANANGDWFWGDCAGLNLKGLLRADTGHCGGLGMVTTMAVKLFPYPCPKTFPVKGTNPDFKTDFPQDRFKVNLIKFTSREKIIDAMYEIGHEELAIAVHEEPASMILCGESPSVEYFWEKWPDFKKKWVNVLSVTLFGFSSPRQVAYEQLVLDKIVEETGGEYITEDSELWEYANCNLGEQFRTGGSNRLYRIAGDFFVMGGFGFDSLDHSLKSSQEFMWPIIRDGIEKGHFAPDDVGNDWLNSYQMGHFSETEPLIYFEHNVEAGKSFIGGYVQTIQEALKRKMSPSWPLGPMTYITGPTMCNYHDLVNKIKEAIDPRLTSNPGYPLPPPPPQG